MSIKSKLKDLIFRRKNYSQMSFEIGDLSNLAILERIKELENDPEAPKEIEQYINKYRQLLVKNDSKDESNAEEKALLSSIDLENSDIYEELKMLVELTRSIFITGSEILFEEKSELKRIVTRRKLDLYKEDIKSMESDLVYRLVALNAVIKENEKKLKIERKSAKKYISDLIGLPIDRERIIYDNLEIMKREFRNLCNSLTVFLTQRSAIDIDTSAYDTVIGNKTIDDIDGEELDNYFARLQMLSKRVLSREVFFDTDKKKNKDERIAALEKRVEEYFYLNPGYKDSLIFRLNSIKERCEAGNLKNLANEIDKLEEDMVFYEEHGGFEEKSKIDERIKIELYTLKFYITTHDYTLYESSLLDSEDKLAQEIYEQEIFDRIGALRKFNNPFLLRLLEKENMKKEQLIRACSFLTDFFKNEDNLFDARYIMNNIYLLQLLVALDSKVQLINWFNRDADRELILTDELNSKYFENEKNISFHPCIPIRTICYRLYSEKSEREHPLTKLYGLFRKELFLEGKIEYFVIPEGIKSFHIMENLNEASDFDKYLYFRMYDKRIVFPKSLRTITIECKDVYFLIFQDGVEEINYTGVFYEMYIPSSVKKLKIECQPSSKYMANINKEISLIDERELVAEHYRFNGNKGRIIFIDYKQSPLLRGNADGISLLPKEGSYEIFLNDGKPKLCSFDQYSADMRYSFDNTSLYCLDTVSKSLDGRPLRDAYIIKVYLIPEKIKERRMELKRFRDEHPELEVDLSRFCL